MIPRIPHVTVIIATVAITDATAGTADCSDATAQLQLGLPDFPRHDEIREIFVRRSIQVQSVQCVDK